MRCVRYVNCFWLVWLLLTMLCPVLECSHLWLHDLCFELVWKYFDCVIHPDVTLCGWQDVKIQEQSNFRPPLPILRKSPFTCALNVLAFSWTMPKMPHTFYMSCITIQSQNYQQRTKRNFSALLLMNSWFYRWENVGFSLGKAEVSLGFSSLYHLQRMKINFRVLLLMNSWFYRWESIFWVQFGKGWSISWLFFVVHCTGAKEAFLCNILSTVSG